MSVFFLLLYVQEHPKPQIAVVLVSNRLSRQGHGFKSHPTYILIDEHIKLEKITFDDNSSKRYRNILRHGLELKWIKLLITPLSVSVNDNIYHEGNISRLPDFDGFFFFFF